MNTFALREEFQIPIAVRDLKTLGQLGILTVDRDDDGAVIAAVVKPLSTVFSQFSRGRSLIPEGSDISRLRYQEIVDGEQLWVRPEAKNYKVLFARWRPGALTDGHDVDHGLSKALAMHLGYGYVRLTLVASHANRSAGSSGEKLALNKGPSKTQLKQLAADPILYADPSDLAKLFNVAQRNSILGGVADFQKNNAFIFGK